MTHTLSLYIPDSTECSVQKVLDTSVYNESFTPTNLILEVTPPGYDCPVVFNPTKDFNITLSVSSLNIIQQSNTPGLTNLPDGVYNYKYSVNPNLKTIVEYNVLRTCKIFSRYKSAMKQLFAKRCKLTKGQFSDKLQELYWIEHLIQAAKYTVEDCEDKIPQGMEMYNEANNLLKDYKECESC
jgi:hypothetical protein